MKFELIDLEDLEEKYPGARLVFEHEGRRFVVTYFEQGCCCGGAEFRVEEDESDDAPCMVHKCWCK